MNRFWWGIIFLLFKNWAIIELSFFHIKEIRVGGLIAFVGARFRLVLRIVGIGENLWVESNDALETFLGTAVQRLLLWRILKTDQWWLITMIDLPLLWWSNCDWIWNLDQITDWSYSPFIWRDYCDNLRSKSKRRTVAQNDRLFGKGRWIWPNCDNVWMLDYLRMETRECMIHGSIMIKFWGIKVFRMVISNASVQIDLLRGCAHNCRIAHFFWLLNVNLPQFSL